MPMPGNPYSNTALSPAVDALGLGDALTEQVAGETEEQRRRRMQEIQQRKLMGSAYSPATASLFGGSFGAAGR